MVLFMPDQLRADAVGCFGSPVAKTPHLDALAARGVRFDDAWSQHPVCGPSRVSIMTGWYPHVHGHRTLDNLLDHHEPNLLRILRDAGYHVAIAGNRGDVFAPGVTETSSDFCGYLTAPSNDAVGAYFTSPYPDDHRLSRGMSFGRAGNGETVLDIDEAATRTAEQWLAEGAPTDQPWVLWVPLIYPHPPFIVDDPWFSLHDRADMPTPISPDAGVGKAGFMAAIREIYGWSDLSPADFAEIAAVYHGMVSRVDDQLGRVLAAIEQIGAMDTTVVGFFTDHGEYLGDYGLVEKWPSGLDPSLLQNPLILAGAGLPEDLVIDQPVEMIDLLPTLLELAETEAEHTHFGRSLLPVMRDPDLVHRRFACAEGGFRPSDQHLIEVSRGIYEPKSRLQHQQPELVGTALVLRTSTHAYVHRRFEADEFYDRRADPSETVNLLTGHRPPIEADQLRDLLFGWLADTSDVIPWQTDPRFPKIPHGWRNES